jgi:hypothetical protein
MAIVTFTTDFGLQDYYVAVMKAVVLRDAPKARLVDVTHCVPKFNIAHGAMVLRRIVEWFPTGTVHLVVVDPGVGSERAVIAFRYSSQYIVCPDNGLVTLVHRTYAFEAARRLDRPGETLPSTTFHGRDIMAPAAAYLAKGGAIEKLGTPAEAVELLDIQNPVTHPDGTVQGQIVYVDSFGNLVTNIQRQDLAHVHRLRRAAEVYIGDQCIGPLAAHYADVPPGSGLGLIDSSELLEIAVHRGNAAHTFGASTGDNVTVK